MYGLVNSSLKNMVIEHFGPQVWERVLVESGAPRDSFLTMRSYDDATTYSLVAAASRVLDEPVETCLEMFGQYWILTTATESYGELLDATGVDLVDFLTNLNGMHDRVSSTFLDYLPPNFRLSRLSGNHYELDYVSQREGLESFVIGLIKGLAIRFGSKVEFLSQRDETVTSGSHTVFEVWIEK